MKVMATPISCARNFRFTLLSQIRLRSDALSSRAAEDIERTKSVTSFYYQTAIDAAAAKVGFAWKIACLFIMRGSRVTFVYNAWAGLFAVIPLFSCTQLSKRHVVASLHSSISNLIPASHKY